MPSASQLQEHATTVAIGGLGVMLRGPSASGKSDLALRLIDQGALLIADDRTCLDLKDDQLIASAPEPLAGKLEVRGLGIVKVSYMKQCPITLVADLVPMNDLQRLPLDKTIEFMGKSLRHINLCAFETSAPVKLKFALTAEWLDLS